jgi:transposase
MSRYDLTDFERRVIASLLPNKPRRVPRVDDRRVLNGIFWVLRSGAPWRDLPERYGPRTTCYNRFVRWRKAGVWDRLMDAITEAHDGDIQMIDSTSIRAHQQAATAKRGSRSLSRSLKGWPHDQNPRGRRPTGAAAPARPDGGSGPRCSCRAGAP